MPIVYYITAHGYGHGARSCDIIKTLQSVAADIPVIIVTDLPESFLRNRLRNKTLFIRKGSFDVGMVQVDSIRVDIPATLDKVECLYTQKDRLLNAGLVVVDIPSLPGIGFIPVSWLQTIVGENMLSGLKRDTP